MKNQAIISFVTAAFLLTGAAFNAQGAPVANSKQPREYLVSQKEHAKWSCGIFVSGRHREVSRNGFIYDFETGSFFGYLGYDIVPWLTLFGAAGATEAELSNGSTSDDSNAEFMAGFNANILDQSILDPLLMEDRFTVNASAYASVGSADFAHEDATWMEINAQLTASLINDLDGSKVFWPEAIAVFGGPVYSDFESDSFDEENTFGLTGGIEVFFTKRVSMNAGVESFEDSSYFSGVHVRF